MTALWDAKAAAEATAGQARGGWQARGISIDSRTLVAGDLFVALAGPNHDGHDHVGEAFARGAAAAMVSRIPDGLADSCPLLRVGDTLAGLVALGRAAVARAAGLTVIGITGSVGKTGTKDMLATALAPSRKVVASARSLNNHIGVPLTLARIPEDATCAVLEFGTSAHGEIAALVEHVVLDVAVITAIAPAHIETLESLEGIARAKSEIFGGLRRGGVAILPADSDQYGLLRARAEASGARVRSFGTVADADARLLRCTASESGTAVRASLDGRETLYRLASFGSHLAINSLAVLLALDALGTDIARACCALAKWTPPAGRGNRETIAMDSRNGFLLLDESYNASPAAMRAAIEGLAQTRPGEGDDGRRGRRLIFLGDMLELGENEQRYHAELANIEAMAAVDLVYACGPRMRALYDALPPHRRGGWRESAAELAARAPGWVRPGDVAMVKGSRAAGVDAVADALRQLGADGS